MAQFNLYIDTNSGESVRGPTNSGQAPLPRFVQGDTISFRIWLLERTTSYPLGANPYGIINNADLSLKVALGPKNGTPGSTLYTQQFTWAKDANNQYFYANIALNTAAINLLIGNGESASAWFEVEYTQNGFPATVFQQSVTIHAEVIETGSVTVPEGATAMTAEEANATFLKRTNSGFYIENATTGHKVFVYLDDNDQVQFSPA